MGIKVAKRTTPEDGAGIVFVQSGAKSLAELVENGAFEEVEPGDGMPARVIH